MVIRATQANGLSFPDFLEFSLQIFGRIPCMGDWADIKTLMTQKADTVKTRA